MISFATQTVVVIRPAWINERGDLVPDWAHAAEHTISRCRVQPVSGDETVSTTRDATVWRWALFAPVGADIQPRDRIRWGGDLYDVAGDVRRWTSATGALAHAEVSLTRVEG